MAVKNWEFIPEHRRNSSILRGNSLRSSLWNNILTITIPRGGYYGLTRQYKIAKAKMPIKLINHETN